MNMNSLKGSDSKLIFAGLGTLAVLGSFIVGLIAYWIMEEAGMNDGLAAALSLVVWVAVVAVSMMGIVSFYSKYANNKENQVTVVREVISPAQPPPALPAVEPVARPVLYEATRTGAVSADYRAMLLAGNNTDEPDPQAFQDESARSDDASESYRSMLDRSSKEGESR